MLRTEGVSWDFQKFGTTQLAVLAVAIAEDRLLDESETSFHLREATSHLNRMLLETEAPSPERGMWHFHLASLYRYLGDFEQALKHWAESTRLPSPGNLPIEQRLGPVWPMVNREVARRIPPTSPRERLVQVSAEVWVELLLHSNASYRVLQDFLERSSEQRRRPLFAALYQILRDEQNPLYSPLILSMREALADPASTILETLTDQAGVQGGPRQAFASALQRAAGSDAALSVRSTQLLERLGAQGGSQTAGLEAVSGAQEKAVTNSRQIFLKAMDILDGEDPLSDFLGPQDARRFFETRQGGALILGLGKPENRKRYAQAIGPDRASNLEKIIETLQKIDSRYRSGERTVETLPIWARRIIRHTPGTKSSRWELYPGPDREALKLFARRYWDHKTGGIPGFVRQEFVGLLSNRPMKLALDKRLNLPLPERLKQAFDDIEQTIRNEGLVPRVRKSPAGQTRAAAEESRKTPKGETAENSALWREKWSEASRKWVDRLIELASQKENQPIVETSIFMEDEAGLGSLDHEPNPTLGDLKDRLLSDPIGISIKYPSRPSRMGYTVLLRLSRIRTVTQPEAVRRRIEELDQFPDQKIKEALSPPNKTGLEEGLEVWTLEDLDQVQPDLAKELRTEKRAGIVVLPAEAIDGPSATPADLTVDVYAHGTVSNKVYHLLPYTWGFDLIHRLPEDPEKANQLLQEAARAVEEKKAVVIGLDYRYQKDLQLPKALVLLLDPDAVLPFKTIATFLAQPNRKELFGLILDLTSGTIRVVEIQGHRYYALDISA